MFPCSEKEEVLPRVRLSASVCFLTWNEVHMQEGATAKLNHGYKFDNVREDLGS